MLHCSIRRYSKTLCQIKSSFKIIIIKRIDGTLLAIVQRTKFESRRPLLAHMSDRMSCCLFCDSMDAVEPDGLLALRSRAHQSGVLGS